MKCPNCFADLVVVKGKLVHQISDVDVQMFPVQSSFINAIGFEPRTKTLKVDMQTGTYLYADVPTFEFAGLLAAASHGTYYGENIRGFYRAWRVS